MMDDMSVNPQSRQIGWNIFSDHEVSNVPGWSGSMTREEAEGKLQDKAPGTYLIRSGDETSALSVDQLMTGNHRLIQHYVLVMKGENDKVSEQLILHTSQGWMTYGDEVHLGAYRPASSLGELMSNLPTSYQPFSG